MPEIVISADTTDTFKRRVDKFWQHQDICYENETRDEKSSRENFDYAKGNYEAMKQELDLIKWEELLQLLSIDESWKKFTEVICKLESNYIPLRRIPKKLSRKPVFDLFCIH